MKITIIGYSGSGKTTLAKKISKKLSIPHIQLDRFWFEAGGLEIMNKKTPEYQEQHERVRAIIRKRIQDAMEGDSWVSDGFYRRFQSEISDKADILIYLDVSLWRRLYNHLKRALFGRNDRHKELNFWNEITFFPEMIRRHFEYKPKFKEYFDTYGDRVVVLKGRKQIDDFVANLSV